MVNNLDTSISKKYPRKSDFFQWIWNRIIPLIIILASVTGLVKAITGIRYGPLLIDGIILLILFVALASKLLNNQLKVGILDYLALILMVFAIMEIFNKNIPSIQTGLEGFRKFAFMIVGFYVGRHIITLPILHRIQRTLVILSTLIALYGIKQFLLPSRLDYRLIELSTASPITYMMGGHIRAFSTMAGPFHLGLFLLCTLLLLFSMYFFIKDKPKWLGLAILVQLLALIMTVTKSNWIALLVGIFILIWYRYKRRAVIRIIFLIILVGVFISIGFVITKDIPEFQTINTGLQAFIDPLNAPTFQIRLELWRDTIIPLIKNGFWFGYGTGSAGEGLHPLFEDPQNVYVTAHNVFLKVQVELGIFGLLFFLIFIFTCLIQVYFIVKHINGPYFKMTGFWILAFLIAVLTAGLTGSILDAYPVNLLFWMLMGVGTRLRRIIVNNSYAHLEKAV